MRFYEFRDLSPLNVQLYEHTNFLNSPESIRVSAIIPEVTLLMRLKRKLVSYNLYVTSK